MCAAELRGRGWNYVPGNRQCQTQNSIIPRLHSQLLSHSGCVIKLEGGAWGRGYSRECKSPKFSGSGQPFRMSEVRA